MSAATIRQRRIVALAVVGAIALLVASVAGARSVFAPSLEATGPAAGAHLDAARLAKLRFAVTGASNVRWTLDGSDVSARATRKGSTQTLRPGELAEGEHRVEVKRGGGFLGAETTRGWSFTVDTTPPSIKLDRPAAARPRRPLVLEGRVEPGARLLIAGRAAQVDDGRFAARFSPPLPRRLLLEAVDLAGNSATRRVPVDIIPRRPAEPVRAVHVTSYGWADADLRRGVMKLIDEKRINAIEIDLKDEAGEVGFDAPVPLGRQIGAVGHVYDLDDVVKKMHARGIRVIGRLVCFRDPVLASASWKSGKRNRVVQTPDGGQYSGYGGFTNFADPAVRKYNIDIAVAAARAGVDDVLYDYVRRPDGPRRAWSSRACAALRSTRSSSSSARRGSRSSPTGRTSGSRSSASRRLGRPRSRRTSPRWRESRTTSRRWSTPRTGARRVQRRQSEQRAVRDRPALAA